MKFPRLMRLIAALIVLISMLFTQLAVAGYACPGFNAGKVDKPMLLESELAMVGCEGMDTAQPGLCHASDQSGNQSLDKPQLPHVQPFMAAALTLVVHHLTSIYNPVSAESSSLLLTRTTAPPLSIRNCCFRI
ncbi:hypothetical protein [Glaciimonas immobilis]|uniref:Uncharacterized protein n=1 Tax=Glaciimonas immobilis TaxID=728004 RepID=A0A840S022_9BURK|nr:hypothetical protein [Glaciimonas immobilis]KAF3995978.1 hypothetical protein HAV38_20955 [Glaciimonas immobilis]MBB5202446.1 hypothetical protein [Glaciimonas immobilis]